MVKKLLIGIFIGLICFIVSSIIYSIFGGCGAISESNWFYAGNWGGDGLTILTYVVFALISSAVGYSAAVGSTRIAIISLSCLAVVLGILIALVFVAY